VVGIDISEDMVKKSGRNSNLELNSY